MFHGLNSPAQARLIVVRSDDHPSLDDPRTAIEFLGDKVHRGTVLRFVRLENPPVGVQARKFRQQRGMNVQDLS